MGRTYARPNQLVPLNHSSLKVIVLDFDGTLVDSNHIKDQAFNTIFSDWPEHKEAMMEWHLARNTIERREKFRYFVEKVLDMPGNDKLISNLTDRFSKLTKKLIIESPLVEGVLEFLDYFHHKTSLFVVSATPQKELYEITLAKGLYKFFKHVYGAPINKTETIKNIQSVENVEINEMLYIGDSPEDQQTAIDVGIHFVARRSDRTLHDMTDLIFEDMNSILYHLKLGNIHNTALKML